MDKFVENGNVTPDASKCNGPEPPPHQPNFISAPYCSTNCTCDGRKKLNEMRHNIRKWIIKRDLVEKDPEKPTEKKEQQKDSGIYSDDSDKENRP